VRWTDKNDLVDKLKEFVATAKSDADGDCMREAMKQDSHRIAYGKISLATKTIHRTQRLARRF
jgi:hypothetical protein